MSIENKTKVKILVTGGAGFLGKAIINELLQESCPVEIEEIHSFDIQKTQHPDHRVHSIQGDVRNIKALKEVTQGIDLIIHSAAIVDWGTKSQRDVFEVNFVGTKNILSAGKINNVHNLVYTSSLDTVFSGKPLININEDQPYPSDYPNMYCQSKFMAEKLVLESNSPELKTCVLRPADIYGEGDIYHIGSLIDMAKGGFYVRLGNRKSKCQHVYVKNIAHAHVLAAKALLNDNEKIYGNPYFITDGPSENFFTFFDQIVIGAGYKIRPSNLWLPKWFGYFLGLMAEGMAKILRPIKYYNPKLSRFAVLYTCTDFTFTSEKALMDFDFKPKYPVKKAIESTINYYKKG